MSRKTTDFLDYGIEEEIDPKIKFNSLLSVTVSTVMCLAAKCPLPKSNIETTKLFLSTITDDNGQGPRNIKGFLSLLNNYAGPYDSFKEKRFEKPPTENPQMEKPSKEKKDERGPSLESLTESKIPGNSNVGKEIISVSHAPHSPEPLSKKPQRPGLKRNEKEAVKKTIKPTGSKISASKSLLSSKL